MSPLDVDALAAEVVLVVKSALDPIKARVASLEAVASVSDVAPVDLAASLTELVTKELSDLGPLMPTLRQKRVIRDAHGRIDRVVEEAMS